jgi:RHS repeat-associated protein
MSEATNGNSFPVYGLFDSFGNRYTSVTTPGTWSEFQWGGAWGYQTEYADASQPGVGLVYMNQRYFDPAIGRFISADPIGYAGGVNLYSYTDNDPINSADPTGLITWDDIVNAPGRWLSGLRKRLFGVGLDPSVPTLQLANDEAYPGLRRAGRDISALIDETEQSVYNNALYAAIGISGAKGAACATSASGGTASGWLAFHEGAGGHTLARHVAQTDAQLIARLAGSKISDASTFSSQAIAETVISRTIAASRSAVRGWLRGAPVNGRFRLDYVGGDVIGRGITKGATAVTDRTDAVIILRHLGGGRYHVLTAYPR